MPNEGEGEVGSEVVQEVAGKNVQWMSLGRLRFGVAKSALPMPDGISMAGFGWASHRGRRAHDALYCRALYLEDHAGHRVAFAVVDLMAVSGAVVDAVADRLSDEFTNSELVISATHTHAAPGHYFGDRFYGSFAQGLNRRSFALQSAWIAQIADAVAAAIREAARVSDYGAFGVGQCSVFGVAHNRSLSAFEANAEAARWCEPDGPAKDASAGLPPATKAIDPRVTILSGVPDAPDRAAACFGFFGCHANSLGPKNRVYHRDWPGYAADAIETLLPGALGAVGQTSGGDASPIAAGLDPQSVQGLPLAMQVGRQIGEVVAAAHQTMPTDGLDELQLSVSSSVFNTEGAGRWAVGWPVILGSAEGRTKFVDRFLYEGMTNDGPPSDSNRDQWPKSEAFRWAHPLLARFRVAPPRSARVHVVRLGGHVLATCPGEISCVGARRLERRLVDTVAAAKSATIIGYAGDYLGYITTPQEYAMQRYEGAHTLFGRGSLDKIANALSPQGAAERLPLERSM